MALIVCPECGKEISDQAEYCIHCGYPIKKISQQQEESKKYQLIIENGGTNQYEVVQRICRLTDYEESTVKEMLTKVPFIFITGLKKEEYAFYEKGFIKRGATVSCQEDDGLKVEGAFDVSELKIKPVVDPKMMECPICHCQVSVEAYKCPECGHPFKEEPHGLGFWGVVGAIMLAILIMAFL